MDEFTATSSAPLTNAIGLHARPSVKLTKLAKTFASQIEVALAEDGPWVDAKSIVKVMAVKAAKGATLHFRARGSRRRRGARGAARTGRRRLPRGSGGSAGGGSEDAHG